MLRTRTALAFALASLVVTRPLQAADSPDALRKLAHDYYQWRISNYPVETSDQGLHVADDRLTDYSPGAIAARRKHIESLLRRVKAMSTGGWSRDDQVDWLLFRAQLEGAAFDPIKVEQSNPQLYVAEISNGIFSLLKKDYDAPRRRALSGVARLEKTPAMLEQGKKNLERPIRLYAELAIDSARSVDALFNDSLMTIAGDLTPAERERLVTAKDRAIKALHDYADWLEKSLPSMQPFRPMGETNYNYILRNVLLLPLDATQLDMLGQAELARYRALEALLPDPAMADPNPARAKDIPADQKSFLQRYESRETEMIQFLEDRHLVTLPDYLGHFSIRQLPEAFKPTSPGGFMNPPGVYDRDPSGFYFIPTYNPKSGNFYIRAAIEDPRPILGHEGIPGHFLQLSIANHLKDEIRRHHGDNVLVEGWALYTEEMLMRTGLYPDGSAAQGQILRLSRYRAARIGVDVNLHTGRWTFDQAVTYFTDAGGLDKESATGEAAGAASDPTQKISYITGKWQIMRLLGRYRDRKGTAFRLGQFHDDLIANGSLPLSIVEWLLLDDRSTLDQVLAAQKALGNPAGGALKMKKNRPGSS